MIIANARFINPEHTIIAAQVDEAWVNIPVDETNRHYLQIQKDEIVVADYVVPSTAELRPGMIVSRFQAKAALADAGLLPSVEAAVAAADTITQLAWAEAIEFRRDSPTIASLAVALELSDAEVDALFLAAAEITA